MATVNCLYKIASHKFQEPATRWIECWKIIAVEKAKKRIEEPDYTTYDFECITYNGTHAPNLVEAGCITPRYDPQSDTISHDYDDCIFMKNGGSALNVVTTSVSGCFPSAIMALEL